MRRIFLITALISAVVAFRPAPPPGTPSFVVEGGFEVDFVYIDAVILDTIAEVVFIASINPNGDSISLLPNWPMDSIKLYNTMNIDTSIEGMIIRAGDRLVLPITERPFFLRTSFEMSVRRPLSGPPGAWSFGEVFAIYPPFEDESGDRPKIPRFQARVILPENIRPIGDDEKFEILPMERGFTSYIYSGSEIKGRIQFQSKN